MSSRFIVASLSTIAIVLAAGLSIAATDEEIVQFASGVLAGSLMIDPDVSVRGDALVLQDKLSEYSDGDVGSIGYNLYDLASAADKIIKQFPGRFDVVETKLLGSNGAVVGIMNISVR